MALFSLPHGSIYQVRQYICHLIRLGTADLNSYWCPCFSEFSNQKFPIEFHLFPPQVSQSKPKMLNYILARSETLPGSSICRTLEEQKNLFSEPDEPEQNYLHQERGVQPMG